MSEGSPDAPTDKSPPCAVPRLLLHSLPEILALTVQIAGTGCLSRFATIRTTLRHLLPYFAFLTGLGRAEECWAGRDERLGWACGTSRAQRGPSRSKIL